MEKLAYSHQYTHRNSNGESSAVVCRSWQKGEALFSQPFLQNRSENFGKVCCEFLWASQFQCEKSNKFCKQVNFGLTNRFGKKTLVCKFTWWKIFAQTKQWPPSSPCVCCVGRKTFSCAVFPTPFGALPYKFARVLVKQVNPNVSVVSEAIRSGQQHPLTKVNRNFGEISCESH